MKRRLVSAMTFMWLLTSMLMLAFHVQPVRAQGWLIYIKSDGSIDPPTAPILTIDNATYTFTDNVYDSDNILVERDNIVIDGTNHTVQGRGIENCTTIGIDLTDRHNVSIRNMKIIKFTHGISLQNSHDNVLHDNVITDSFGSAFLLYRSDFNTISANIAKNNNAGISLQCSCNNTLYDNIINMNAHGITLTGYPPDSTGNSFYRNVILDNANQAYAEGYPNSWDDGYPSGGNYWSDYNGTDEYSGPDQNLPGSDGIGDIPYVMNHANKDDFPLMSPDTLTEYRDLRLLVNVGPQFPQPGYPCNLNVTVENNGLNNEADVELLVLVNGTVDYSQNVTFLGRGESYGFSYVLFPEEGTFNVTTYTPALLGEKLVEDNVVTVWLTVGGPVHNVDAGLSYPTIQAAIDALETVDGQTIGVEPGTYVEHVVISKSIRLLGESPDATIIDGQGTGTVVTITANGATFSGFTIQNSGISASYEPYRQAIYLSEVSDCNVSHNIIIDNEGGVWGRGSRNIIEENSIKNNSIAIYLFSGSQGNVIRNNTVLENGEGIYLTSTIGTLMSENMIVNRGFGQGIFPYDSVSDVIENNVIAHYSEGIWLSGCYQITITNNTLWGGLKGIYLSRSNTGITIKGNTIAINQEFGISKMPGDPSGSGFTIFHNNFINNTQNVLETAIYGSKWDDGYPSGGNYWDDYEEIDANGDGLGDVYYAVDAANQDEYPLVHPYPPIRIVWNRGGNTVEIESNSTISKFRFGDPQRTISFNVTGPDGTIGFCTLTIPNSLVQDLWQGNFTVLVDGKEPLLIGNWTDSAYTYIYFTYEHSTKEVTIVPEFPSLPVLLLLIMASLLAAIAYRKRKQSFLSRGS